MVKDSKIDRVLIVVTALLILFGLIMVYSSTMILAKERFGDSFHFLKRQVMWLMLGLIIAVIISYLRYPIYLKSKVVLPILLLAIAGLIGVFLVGKINNSYRWIRFAGFSIQPSEFAKIAIVLYLSWALSRDKFDINDIKKLLFYLAPFFVIELLILKEPDLGNFLLILTITMMLLFVAGLKLRYFFYSFIGLLPLFYMVIKMHPEKMNRIMAFLKPEEYVQTYGFQALQSIYAVGSGGIFGKGLGKSTQKLYFLPYAYSDFIYAIVGEEVGLVGALAVVALFVIFLVRGINVARGSGSRQAYLLVTGLTFLIVIQAMINISVTIGIFPTKGIPLPFISNGGTSMVASLIIVGIILNISKQRKTVFLND
ncbi:MAG: putative lipid II flippase FtsW [bacterium]|nr:putative lipid II flippase FtsW [bacterium]